MELSLAQSMIKIHQHRAHKTTKQKSTYSIWKKKKKMNLWQPNNRRAVLCITTSLIQHTQGSLVSYLSVVCESWLKLACFPSTLSWKLHPSPHPVTDCSSSHTYATQQESVTIKVFFKYLFLLNIHTKNTHTSLW